MLRMTSVMKMLISFLVALSVFRSGATVESLDFTITPAETTEFADQEVTLECKASGLQDDAASIRSMEISKKGANLPLASLYPIETILRHTELLQSTVNTNGRIDDHNLTNSFLSVTFNDPTHVQSGDYVCNVVYVVRTHNGGDVIKTMESSSTLNVQAVDSRFILQQLKQLQRQSIQQQKRIDILEDDISKKDASTKQITNVMGERINTMETDLSKKEAEMISLKKMYAQFTIRTTSLEEASKACCKKCSLDVENAVKEFYTEIDKVACPGDDWQYFNGMCYREITVVRDWDDANSHCQDLKGSLAVIEDQKTNDFLFNKFNWEVTNGHWIGIIDRETTKEDVFNFVTVDGDKPVYTNWRNESYYSKKTLNVEYCADFFTKTGEWDYYPCSATDQSLCQIEPKHLLTTAPTSK